MRASDKIAAFIGVLDLVAILWALVGIAVGGSGITVTLFNLRHWDSPIPVILGAMALLTYMLILVCGALLVLRTPRFAWLNYILFPLRLVFFLPTLFPVFMMGNVLGLAMHPVVSLSLLVVTEVAFCVFVYFWRLRHLRQNSARSAASTA